MQQVPAHSQRRSQSELLRRRCCITRSQLGHMEPLLLPQLQLLCWSVTAVSGVLAYLFGRTQHCKLAFLAQLTMTQADVKSVGVILLIAGSSSREASAATPRPASATQPSRTQGDTSWWEAAESLLQKERRQYSTSQLTPEAVQELQIKGHQVTKLLTKLVNNRVQHGLDPSVSCHCMPSF